MQLSITPVGIVVVVSAVLALMLARRWLLSLLIVSAVLQAPAVLVIQSGANEGIGITPWVVLVAACGLHALALGWHNGWVRSAELSFGQTWPWMVFFALALATSFVGPWLHGGIQVYELGNRLGFDTATVPLQWTAMNLIQGVNVVLVACALAYAALMARIVDMRTSVIAGICGALVVSVLLGVYQRAEWLHLAPALEWFHDSANPSYVHREGRYFVVSRLHWPFVEPSYASVWFGSAGVAGLAVMLLGRHIMAGFIVATACAFALANTVGGSGIAAASAMALVVGGVFVHRAVARRGEADSRLALRLAACAALAGFAVLGGFVLARASDGKVTPSIVLGKLVDQRLQWFETKGDTRTRSNDHALELIRATWPTGVGLGSNRASSYLASMASNLGVPLTMLFLLLCGRLAYRTHDRHSSIHLFAVFGMVTSLVGIALAIPDLNWPGWWVWPVMCTALLRGPQPGDAATTGWA